MSHPPAATAVPGPAQVPGSQWSQGVRRPGSRGHLPEGTRSSQPRSPSLSTPFSFVGVFLVSFLSFSLLLSFNFKSHGSAVPALPTHPCLSLCRQRCTQGRGLRLKTGPPAGACAYRLPREMQSQAPLGPLPLRRTAWARQSGFQSTQVPGECYRQPLMPTFHSWLLLHDKAGDTLAPAPAAHPPLEGEVWFRSHPPWAGQGFPAHPYASCTRGV